MGAGFRELWHALEVTARRPGDKADAALARVAAAVRERKPDADAAFVERAVSLCGLVASVAYIDRKYTESERPHLRRVLELLPGFEPSDRDALCTVVEAQLGEIAQLDPSAYARALCAGLDATRRGQILDALAELAAADDAFTLIESDSLRRTAQALGLTPEDVLRIETRHSAKRKRLG